MAKSYFKNHPVQSGVAVGVILLFISSTGITAWLQNIAWWDAIKNVVIAVWKAIVWFMTIHIPLWGILLFFIVLFAGIYAVLYNAIRNQSNKTESIPSWVKYKSDKFDNFNCEWSFIKNEAGQYIVDDINVLCPNCGTVLVPQDRDSYDCPRCSEHFGYPYNNGPKQIKFVEAIIYDNIKRNKYKL